MLSSRLERHWRGHPIDGPLGVIERMLGVHGPAQPADAGILMRADAVLGAARPVILDRDKLSAVQAALPAQPAFGQFLASGGVNRMAKPDAQRDERAALGQPDTVASRYRRFC